MTTEDYLKLYIGQLVIEEAVMLAEIEKLRAQISKTPPPPESPPGA